jgi:hypothetical protein
MKPHLKGNAERKPKLSKVGSSAQEWERGITLRFYNRLSATSKVRN